MFRDDKASRSALSKWTTCPWILTLRGQRSCDPSWTSHPVLATSTWGNRARGKWTRHLHVMYPRCTSQVNSRHVELTCLGKCLRCDYWNMSPPKKGDGLIRSDASMSLYICQSRFSRQNIEVRHLRGERWTQNSWNTTRTKTSTATAKTKGRRRVRNLTRTSKKTTPDPTFGETTKPGRNIIQDRQTKQNKTKYNAQSRRESEIKTEQGFRNEC